MALKVGSYSGRAPGSNWFKVSGSLTMNGTTVVSDTFELPHHAERGVISLKATGGTATRVYTVYVFNSDNADVDNLTGMQVNEDLVAVGTTNPAGETSEVIVIGEGSTGAAGGCILPSGTWTVAALTTASDTGVLVWEAVFKLG